MPDNRKVHFILNGEKIETAQWPGMVLLDFIRKHLHLKGTKIGCREGDCGACTVLVGELGQTGMEYHTETSCLMPLGNAQAKHIVTVEGINCESLTPVQQAICEHGAAQCGFCTVGFVMSLTEFCLSDRPATKANIIAAMDGNICRCTGYLALKRAASELLEKLREKPKNNALDWLIKNGFVPAYFADIPAFLKHLPDAQHQEFDPNAMWMGGGTDLNVQQPERMRKSTLNFALNHAQLKGIEEKGDQILIGAATTTEEIRRSPILQEAIPDLPEFMKLISSTPIRNMATLGGNLANASPIGDLSIIFLALNAHLGLEDQEGERRCRLRDFFKGYKKLDLRPGEHIRFLAFPKPNPNTKFRFEKVSKRTHLDIASVNAAASLTVEDNRITQAHLSAGGVAPIPLFLEQACGTLKGQQISETTARTAADAAMREIAPISDIRGSAQYKSLLLRQLIYAHFLTLFPETIRIGGLV